VSVRPAVLCYPNGKQYSSAAAPLLAIKSAYHRPCHYHSSTLPSSASLSRSPFHSSSLIHTPTRIRPPFLRSTVSSISSCRPLHTAIPHRAGPVAGPPITSSTPSSSAASTSSSSPPPPPPPPPQLPRRSSPLRRLLLLLLFGSALGTLIWHKLFDLPLNSALREGRLPPLPTSPPPAVDPLAEERLPPLLTEMKHWSRWDRFFFYVRMSLRGVFLVGVWSPVFLLALCMPLQQWLRWIVVPTLERCGAVFIKLGQWAATRPDLFSDECCEELSRLQAAVAPHNPSYTLEACKRSFGAELEIEGYTLKVDNNVLGSGSMGQVQSGSVQTPDGRRISVAIKVLHPGTEERVRTDLCLMYFAAKCINALPWQEELEWVSIPEMSAQFSQFMATHMNLEQEARNMMKFRQHFKQRSVWWFARENLSHE